MVNDKGFCLKCNIFYIDEGRAFGTCPKGHALLHAHKCQFCPTILYFQIDDDHCAPNTEDGIICGKCALEKTTKKNEINYDD